jgi:hypothetical protein
MPGLFRNVTPLILVFRKCLTCDAFDTGKRETA